MKNQTAVGVVFTMIAVLTLLTPHRGAASHGSRIAFTSDRDGNLEIYVMNEDGKDQTRLTNSPGDDQDPEFSDDGERIVFSSTRDGNAEIYVMKADGTEQTRLTNHPAADRHPTISRDKSMIVFTRLEAPNDEELYFANLKTNVQRKLLARPVVQDTFPTWDPLRDRVHYASNKDGFGPGVATRGFQIWGIDVNSEGQTSLEGRRTTDFRENDNIHPAPHPEDPIFAVAKNDSDNDDPDDFDIYTCESCLFDENLFDENTETTNLTADEEAQDEFPSWSPNGNRIAFSKQEGKRDIFVIDADGKNLQRRTGPDVHDDFDPSFSKHFVQTQESSGSSLQAVSSRPPATNPDRFNCSDFPNQEAAQRIFDADRTDPHRLDPDRDGIACEELVRASSTATPARVQPKLTG